jgi:hypothetical protein
MTGKERSIVTKSFPLVYLRPTSISVLTDFMLISLDIPFSQLARAQWKFWRLPGRSLFYRGEVVVGQLGGWMPSA